MDHGMQLYINGRASVSIFLIFCKIKSLKIRNKYMHFTSVGDITKMTIGNNIAFLSNNILTPVTSFYNSILWSKGVCRNGLWLC